ncbi:hypothetical protein [Alienimonas californiensis]|uniref:Uncharacterized protein n=1 Tax=Alienimonas californiensis TaxID=2527989 RepID=A0A517PED4_9PLAN|nr:hypothetical protein [Alienimonas californiensis]QDT17737.1 hypothetical protein CA12_38690 [Alienimonas californiensis]
MTPSEPDPPRNRPALWGGFAGSLAATPCGAALASLTASRDYVLTDAPGLAPFLDLGGWVCLTLSNLLTVAPFGLLPGWLVGRWRAEKRSAVAVAAASGFLCTGGGTFLLWRFFLFAASQ